MKESHSDKDKVIETSKQTLDELQNQLEKNNQEIESLNKTLDSLQDALGEKNKEFEKLEEKYSSGEMDRDTLEMEIQNHLSTIKDKD